MARRDYRFNMNEKISIIMAIYNDKEWADSAIQSVLQQTYENWELIVVDDGSIDGTQEIIGKYAERDSRIRFIQNQHCGVSFARWTAYTQCEGQWITFMDGDDVLHPMILSILIDTAQKEKVSIVKVKGENVQNPVVTRNIEIKELNHMTGKDYITESHRAGNNLGLDTGVLWAKLYKRALFETRVTQGWIENKKTVYPFNFFEDIILVPLLYGQAEDIVNVQSDVSLYYHRCAGDGISSTFHVTQYNYEQVYLVCENIHLFEKWKMDEMVGLEIVSGFLLLLSIWYKGKKTDESSLDFIKFEENLKEYYSLYCNRQTLKNVSFIKRGIIFLWKKSPKLWEVIMEKVYFSNRYQ